MRPQHITAENPVSSSPLRREHSRASMRPQHITAENRGERGIDYIHKTRFNEAAAYHCGKPSGGRLAACSTAAASMRPQHITAENHLAQISYRRPSFSFNEAAAYHCGKPRLRPRAGGLCRNASMRPQHITAENLGPISQGFGTMATLQ